MSASAPRLSDSGVGAEEAAPKAHLFGLSAALVTAFGADGRVDTARTAAHAARLIADGVDGVTLFGTTGEGPSIGLSERADLLDAVLAAGLPADAITIGIAASDLESALAQARLGRARGVGRLLLAPPFYFKGVDDGPLEDWFAAFIERAGPDASVILYHIPQVTAVPLSVDLVRRLKTRCGEAVFGVKDSAGVFEHTRALLALDDVAIMVGDERHLAAAAPLGGAGAISGMANLVPSRVGRLIHGEGEDADLSAIVTRLVTAPVTPLVKALVGLMGNDETWFRTRPPLAEADPMLAAELSSALGLRKT